MVQRCWIRMVMLLLVLMGTSQTLQADPQDRLQSALNAWRSGDLDSAHAQLSDLIAEGSEDPRPYFYRGIVSSALGMNADEDFQTGARLEARTGNTRLVSLALEKTQGSLRARIEKIRKNAQAEYKADPEAIRQNLLYRDALELRRQGDLKGALAAFETLTEKGQDPRYFYMQGVVLAETGDQEKAVAAFSEGLRRESSLADVDRVNAALSGVQGPIRQLIEEQTTVRQGDVVVTRQSNRRGLQGNAARAEDQLLAQSNAAAAEADRQAMLEQEERRREVAEGLAASRQADQDRDTLLAQTPPAEPEQPAATATEPTPMPMPNPMPTTNAANPFLGGTATTPLAAAESDMVAAVSSVTAGPIDMSYLPPSTELLVYSRPADMLASGFLQPYTSSPEFEMSLEQGAAQLGFSVRDIDSVTVGIANVIATVLPIATQAAAGTPPNPNAISQKLMGENGVIVMRLLKDTDISTTNFTRGGTATEYQGKTYYMIQPPDPSQPALAAYAADARTIILAGEKSVKEIIDNGPGEAERSDFSFVSRSNHAVITFAAPLLAGMSGSIPDPPPTAPPFAGPLVSAIKGKINGAGIVVDFGSDATLNLVLNLSESEAVTAAAQPLSEAIAMAQQFAPLALANAPAELQAPLQGVVGSLSSSADGSQLKATATISSQLLQVLKENPFLLMPQMQPGGFGPPGAGAPPIGAPPFEAPPGAGGASGAEQP